MRHVHTIVLHYSATYCPEQDIGAAEIDGWHRLRGFGPFARPDGRPGHIGYHWVVRLDGRIEAGRPEALAGVHVRGHNTGTIGVCAVGGLRRATGTHLGHDTRTPAQKATLARLVSDIIARHPGITRVLGHRDLAATQCPAYDVAAWWREAGGRRDAAEPLPYVPAVSWPLLRRGSRGAQVVQLQSALGLLGHDPGPADGIFGPRTAAAVLSFQRSAGILADGIVGPATWAEILRRHPDRSLS
jgi:N-acetyl-anhydromuramyl-L-alanine amidase AmpD